MTLEPGYSYMVHAHVSFFGFCAIHNHFGVQKLRFSLSHLLQDRPSIISTHGTLRPPCSWVQRRSSTSAQLGPTSAPSQVQLSALKWKYFFYSKSRIVNCEHKCRKRADMVFNSKAILTLAGAISFLLRTARQCRLLAAPNRYSHA